MTRGHLVLDDSLMCHLLDFACGFGDMTRKSVVADKLLPFVLSFFLTIAFNNVVTFRILITLFYLSFKYTSIS